MKKALLLIFCFVASIGYIRADNDQDYWAADSAWYRSQDTISNEKIDLIYLVSTNILSATSPSGEKAYRALLTADDRKVLDLELAYVEQNIGKGDFNYIAPYYHQFTFDAIGLPSDDFKTEYQKVAKEVGEAFDYYMAHINHGRPFALVGFSQGGMLVLDLLKHMTDEQYSLMVAAYALGYRISAEDIRSEHIVPATDETTCGVTVSFNSVLNDSAIWSVVAGDAATVINPISWTTDTTTATFTFEGHPHKVHLDPTTHLLIVETPHADEYRRWNANPVFQSAHVPLDCLHHWDLLFYTDYIHDNIRSRALSKRVYRDMEH